jgi:tocopherol cyclase
MHSTADRNGYMLRGRLAREGYDWWWHSLVAEKRGSGERGPFFFEYYVINPALGDDAPVFGQRPENRANGVRPSYAMVKAGRGGDRKVQLHRFEAIAAFSAERTRLDVRIGDCAATETRLCGHARVTPEEAALPERMTDAGELRWELEAAKALSYSVGYGASRLFRGLDAFRMFWHVQGMRTRYRGLTIYDGETFEVRPDTCTGYQDKNWGKDYTNPWVWLSCNCFADALTGRPEPDASLVLGGGVPIAFGIPFGRKVLVAFHYRDEWFDYNFSHFNCRQDWRCREEPDRITWDAVVQRRGSRLELAFSCPKSAMLLVNYENPRGEKNHSRLWNGGHAAGELRLFRKVRGRWSAAAHLHGEFGGCEFGEY